MTDTLDGPVVPFFAGDTWILPITWWQTPPTYNPDGSVATPGVPVNMTGMTPSAELLAGFNAPASLAVTGFVPASGTFKVTVPGYGKPTDLTSGLKASPALPDGPRIRVHYTDSVGNRSTFGTFYVQVK